MRNRAARFTLFLIVVLALGGAAYEVALLEQQADTTAQTGRAFDARARQAEAAVRELRAAQFAYVAPGQGAAFWIARAGALLTAVAADLKALCAMDQTVAGLKAGDAACTQGLENLATAQRLDNSVHGYLGEDQRLLASDLVFVDLREADQTLLAWMERARQSQAGAHRAASTAFRNTQIATAAGAGIFALLVLVLLVPIGKPEETGSDEQGPQAAVRGLGIADSLPIRAIESPWPPAPAREPVAVDLGAAAALCTELACVRESTDLPALLERVATLLDAAGLIVWVEEGATGQLRPALTHGYSPLALARIGAISKDADNATASACRECRLRVVEARAPGNGALAVPLLGPDGCVGVMAAEIRGGREREAALQAVATMIAAQMTTLVGAEPPQAQDGAV